MLLHNKSLSVKLKKEVLEQLFFQSIFKLDFSSKGKLKNELSISENMPETSYLVSFQSQTERRAKAVGTTLTAAEILVESPLGQVFDPVRHEIAPAFTQNPPARFMPVLP